jgi:23S rRNA G2445 N2-methylase RlmL
VRFVYTGAPGNLLALQTATAVYAVCTFDIPRPQALLGDANLRRLLQTISMVRGLHPAAAFRTLGISAAGADSPVMQRLGKELAARSGLSVATDEADLLLHIRRVREGVNGWEVLVRLSPRPLSTRPWRVCNMNGALNAVVAQAMVRLARPQSPDCFLNLCCGSGTLLIERAAYGPVGRLIGCDIAPAALACAQANIQASGHAEQIELHGWDAQALPLPSDSIDTLCADLPFGFAVGSHVGNIALYPALLQEAGRVAKPGARLVLLTHDVRLMEEIIGQSAQWRVADRLRIQLRTVQPIIFVLARKP